MNTAKRDGFTLIELMITTLIIGILAAVAIPNFMAYQARSRRTEAFANLQALARAQTTYWAEKDKYFATDNAYPAFGAPLPELGTFKMTWNAEAVSNYLGIGWAPEGKVYYSYEVNTNDNASCDCAGCFTATAYGDVDGDGEFSAVMFVHRDAFGDSCTSLLMGFGAPTGGPGSLVPVYDEVAVNRSTDEF